MNPTYLSSKPHYEILDGLRGVAALMVVLFHILEVYSAGNHADQVINHGYLAVDFFFVLSGFVIGYAYDDRWNKMSYKDFFKRRLIRLQPMVVIGMIIGAIAFYFSDSTIFANISEVPVWKVLLVMLLGCFMIPMPLSMDIRGWQETYPLNGPGWSLFFEYIANILYALVIRRFSKTMLSILVFLAGCALIHFAVTNPNGDIIGGWSLTGEQLRVGFTRLTYPFFAGLLLSRVAKLTQIKGAFWLCSFLVILILSIPRIGGDKLWMNGLYDAFSIIFLFPLIVYLGASGKVKGKYSTSVCKFLGGISYPLYITHYPLIYIYTGWVVDHKPSWQSGLLWGSILYISSILIAYACLKLYDEPVREWLKKKFLMKKA